MTKGSIQQEDTIIQNLYAPNDVVSKNIKQKVSELNGKVHLQSGIDRKSR